MARVLVIDDQADKRVALAAALSSEGIDAQAIGSAEAPHAARTSAPCLAIVDLVLHGTNGFELARRLREEAPAVGVILTSEYHFSPTQLARVDCGAIAFVPRPFSLGELAEFLKAKLEARIDSRRPPVPERTS